ncbi:MAG: YdeI/OmpD-associated family protein [Gemmatimonadetes bacterium]|nr:YdeI/OmpD-associated family protein [Gemmatimonadota bacterium]
MMQTTVDGFLADGCGRCAHFATPQCKVHPWRAVLARLRALVLSCGLAETVKWGMPCYTVDGKNVVLLGALRDRCTISFLKGSLLDDPEGVLEAAGPHSRVARQVNLTSLEALESLAPALEALVRAAAAAERAGARVAPAPTAEPVPAEFEAACAEHPGLAAAFAALTPGRRRGYLLHFGGAKQAATRARRIAACVPAILAGKGLQD